MVLVCYCKGPFKQNAVFHIGPLHSYVASFTEINFQMFVSKIFLKKLIL